MSRKGQVYILYNKVQSIEECRDRIQRLVPDARIGIAHGQMNKNELESTVYDFTNNPVYKLSSPYISLNAITYCSATST